MTEMKMTVILMSLMGCLRFLPALMAMVMILITTLSFVIRKKSITIESMIINNNKTNEPYCDKVKMKDTIKRMLMKFDDAGEREIDDEDFPPASTATSELNCYLFFLCFFER